MKIGSLLTLLERTMGSLVSVTKNAFGPDRETDSNKVQVKDVQYIPMAEQGLIQVRAKTYSSHESGPYQSVIALQNIQYINEEEYNEMQNSGQPTFQFVSTGGTKFFVTNEQNANDVRVRCTCEDFRWRFASQNYSDQTLQGDPPEAYVKKTDRPSVNPSNSPGVCKHLVKLKKELERENFFRSLLN